MSDSCRYTRRVVDLGALPEGARLERARPMTCPPLAQQMAVKTRKTAAAAIRPWDINGGRRRARLGHHVNRVGCGYHVVCRREVCEIWVRLTAVELMYREPSRRCRPKLMDRRSAC